MIDETKDGEKKVYEVGYLVIPAVTEDQAISTTAMVVSAIESHGGAVIAQGNPVLQDLAYSIGKKEAGKYSYYDRAYFGWVKFEMDPSGLKEVTGAITKIDAVLRSLISITTRAAITSPARRAPQLKKYTKPTQDEQKPQLSSEQIDKEVDQLIATTETV